MASTTLLATYDLASTPLNTTGFAITGIDAYDEIIIDIEDAVSSSGILSVMVRFSNDGGSTYRTATGSYSRGYLHATSSAYTHNVAGTVNQLYGGQLWTTAAGGWGALRVLEPGRSDFKTILWGELVSISYVLSVGECETAEVNNALKLYTDTGSTASGKINVYGVTYKAENFTLLLNRNFATTSLSAGASIDVTGIDAYDEIWMRWSGLTNSDASGQMYLYLSDDGGSTFKTGASDYYRLGHSITRYGNTAGSYMNLAARGASYGAGEARLFFHDTAACGTILKHSTTGSTATLAGMARRVGAEVNDALRLEAQTGNYTAGRLLVYGFNYAA